MMNQSFSAALTRASIEVLEGRRLLASVTVSDVAGLINAVDTGNVGDTINVTPGNYVLGQSLRPKADMTIVGTGPGVRLQAAAGWTPDVSSKPDSETSLASTDAGGYFIDLGTNNGSGSHINGVDGVTIQNLEFDGDGRLYGAIVGQNADDLTLRNNTIEQFAWSGVRTRSGDGHLYEGNLFTNAGGKIGATGGMVFNTYLTTSIIRDNVFDRTAGYGDVYGVKGRQFRTVEIAENSMFGGSFSIELPFENDQFVTIRNNFLSGVVSIPKQGGGAVPTNGFTFDIRENYFRNSYSIEGPRNGITVHRNLFDFETGKDKGNLVSQFGGSTALNSGPFVMHNNLIKNPGRGVFWSDPPQNGLTFRNNEVIANTTATPRTEGLFGIKVSNNTGTTDFSTIRIADNVITVNGQQRPLMRNDPSRTGSVIENNTLTGITDTGSYSNPNTRATRGLQAPLLFDVGADAAFTVDGWNLLDNASGPNQQPTSVALSPTNIDENLPAGSVVGTFTTVDPDTNDSHTYKIVSGQDKAKFAISGNQLVTTEPLDYETKSNLKVRVRTTDAGGLFTAKTFTINVNDLPDNGGGGGGGVPAGSPTGTLVGLMTPDDPDVGDTHTYTIIGGTDRDAFAVDGDRLETTADLATYNAGDVLSVRVRVTDAGGLFRAQTLNVTLTAQTASAMTSPGPMPLAEQGSIFATFSGKLLTFDRDDLLT